MHQNVRFPGKTFGSYKLRQQYFSEQKTDFTQMLQLTNLSIFSRSRIKTKEQTQKIPNIYIKIKLFTNTLFQ